MAYIDGGTFTTYCDKHYDRHQYKLVMKNGKSEVFNDYKVCCLNWYQSQDRASHIEVLDTSGKGF